MIKYALTLSAFITCNLAAAELNLNDIKWPPYFFPRLESVDKPGIAKEILNKCITDIGHTISYKNLPIKRTHLYMQSGEIDISVYSYKESREKFVVYGKENIFDSEYGFASRQGDSIKITKLTDLYKYRFGHLAGLSHTPKLMEIVEEKRRNEQLTEGYDLDAMFGQLLATPQRFEVMANSKETFYWRAKQLDIQDKIKVHDFTVKTKPYFITVSKSTSNIKDIDAFLLATDRCLIDLKKNGQYQTIIEKYGLK